jgi:hypothetical protein
MTTHAPSQSCRADSGFVTSAELDGFRPLLYRATNTHIRTPTFPTV